MELIQNNFTKILQKEMALGPTTLSHLQGRTLIRSRTPKREKNSQQQQQQPVKEVNNEEWANNAQYTAT